MQKNLPAAANIQAQTQLFKLLSEPTRLTLLYLLADGDSRCVCDLVTQLQQPQPTVSRHLGHLKSAGLLTAQRRGTWMWYQINPQLPPWQRQLIDFILAIQT